MNNRKKILVIEDEFQFAKMVKLRLESVGFEVHIAGDAYDGTQQVLKNDFDLLIVDLMMPAGGGLALLERVRKFPSKSLLPVIILTGKTVDDVLRKQADDLDVNAIISKPYDSQEFAQKVMSLVN